MTLRAELRSAIDDVTPPAPALERKVAAFIRADARDRGTMLNRRPRLWIGPVRGSVALVAAVVVVALMAGLVVGARLWIEPSTTNAHQIDKTELKNLESRPLSLPNVGVGAACPAGPTSSYEGFGAGPVALVGGLPSHTKWGIYAHTLTLTDHSVRGLVLGRGRDLVTGNRIVFVGEYAAGPAVGTDTVDGSLVKQRLEVLLDTSHPPSATADSGKFVVWGTPIGLAQGASTCLGFQFDGPDFSETFVAELTWNR